MNTTVTRFVWVVCEDSSDDVARGVLGVFRRKREAIVHARGNLIEGYSYTHTKTKARYGVAESWFDSVEPHGIEVWPFAVQNGEEAS